MYSIPSVFGCVVWCVCMYRWCAYACVIHLSSVSGVHHVCDTCHDYFCPFTSHPDHWQRHSNKSALSPTRFPPTLLGKLCLTSTHFKLPYMVVTATVHVRPAGVDLRGRSLNYLRLHSRQVQRNTIWPDEWMGIDHTGRADTTRFSV